MGGKVLRNDVPGRCLVTDVPGWYPRTDIRGEGNGCRPDTRAAWSCLSFLSSARYFPVPISYLWTIIYVNMQDVHLFTGFNAHLMTY